jgi:endonuclease/exonuclease/phosphatase family metal-dependent hydrolase
MAIPSMSGATRVLKVTTYNIHKGFSHFNRRMMVHELRDHLRGLGADIVFLQEVQGEHERHAARFEDWPAEPQYEFLADSVWGEFSYGRNAVYDHGHHGNAILSRYPILSSENQDVSSHAFERRGLLHCEIGWPDTTGTGAAPPLHCVCVHLALNERGRGLQIGALIERVRRTVPDDAPLVVAGDFNDWRNRAGRRFAAELGLTEAFRDHRGASARSFPSAFPLLRLDRIYTRGFVVQHTEVHHGLPWSRISDHAALSARLALA